ncbi:MAG: T9SS type A sorting domain-containing protein [Bacteroidales bacterium]|nr:T9SS type A sorting domain-containing protein [Bacteroidales bacterium]
MKKKLRLMKKTGLAIIVSFILSGSLFAQSGIFAGGPIYYDRSFSINELRNSGYTFVVVWTIHVMNTNGDLNFNAEFPLIENGQYIGNATYPYFASDMALLKTAPTSINRIEVGLSGWGSSTFAHIKTLVNSEGTGPGSKLYENFKALKEAIPQIDAVNFDDESTYDAASATAFAVMLADLGYKVTLCPYTASSFWNSVAVNTNSQRPGAVDGVYLQCYAGGAGNNPCSWNIGGLPIWPGLETASKTASQVESQLNTWQNQCGITGGWVWLYDHIKNSSKVADYANAINNALDIGAMPGQASNPSPSNGATNVSRNIDLSWTAGSSTTSRNVYFGTDNTPDASELQGNQVGTTFDPGTLTENTTYYWRIDEVNAQGTTTGTVWSFTTGTDASVSIDQTDPVGTGTITARAQISTTESAARAFDNLFAAGTQNSTWSKWLDNGGVPGTSSPSWIQIQLPTAVSVNKLAIVSANDDFGRDPKDFNLQGSNNGSSWTTLNSWSNETFTSRFQRREFPFTNTATYSYYRLNITKNDENVSMTQLCEIELFGPQSSTPALPGAASNPNPANGATNVSLTADLSWTAGSGATSHDVYFGTDPTPDNTEFQNFYTVTTFDPGTLAENTTYYWRIDENNSAGTTTGPVWSFTTGLASSCNSSPLSLSIHFDNYPEETSWTVKQGTSTVASGGTYGGQPDGSTKVESIALNSGNYTFTMNDSYGDGICCGYGSGSFTLTDAGGATLLTGSNFGSSVSKTFCIGSSSLKSATETEIPVKNIADYELKIYPNPFTGAVKIVASEQIKAVYLTDMNGKVMHVNKLGSKMKELNFDGLQKGVYLLKVEYDNGIKEIRKLIKE